MDITSILAADPTAAAQRVSNSLARAAAATATTGSTSTSTSTSADGTTITSNDFLTLLVTEMKNQDPTQPTDPNAYIQQLVGVNSLQQLISINQELGEVATTPSATPVTGS